MIHVPHGPWWQGSIINTPGTDGTSRSASYSKLWNTVHIQYGKLLVEQRMSQPCSPTHPSTTTSTRVMSTRRYFNVSQLLQKRLASTRLLFRTGRTSLSQDSTIVLPAGLSQIKCPRSPSFSRHPQRSCTSKTVNVYDEPTIFALSTAPGKSAIAIIRISGPACLKVRFCVLEPYISQ